MHDPGSAGGFGVEERVFDVQTDREAPANHLGENHCGG